MNNYNILISQEEKYFVVKNIDLWIVSQWESIDDALFNIKEATELFLEKEKEYKNVYSRSFLTTISV
ncbi:MAG: hypothetical protein ACD_49C00077G0014 [uncultured bacterium (gcode 4)]|uniref:HicB family protein n=1 Tax=uncultured bacterium (gcode 4) TaxID=1234023 RepID=K2AW11_9BACT|nr:MAG: hypothetical protein ACD_49C00077G0014 [uncultured bacterium (gcode 4)]